MLRCNRGSTQSPTPMLSLSGPKRCSPAALGVRLLNELATAVSRVESDAVNRNAMELFVSARYILAENPDDLGAELSNMLAGETAYITANDYKRMTGERLDEFSTGGKRMIGDMAAQSWCAIRVQRDCIFFTKQ
jgi:hypothetical protein